MVSIAMKLPVYFVNLLLSGPKLFSRNDSATNTAGASATARGQTIFSEFLPRRLCWKRWISVTVGTSQQPRGSSCVVRSGQT